MLKRHYELVRELKVYEKIAVDELSVEDISYYLGLRREYEEICGQFINLVPSALEKLKKLIDQSGEQLEEVTLMVDSVLEGEKNRNWHDFIGQILDAAGKLETHVEQVIKGCSFLYQTVETQFMEPLPEEKEKTRNQSSGASGASIKNEPVKSAPIQEKTTTTRAHEQAKEEVACSVAQSELTPKESRPKEHKAPQNGSDANGKEKLNEESSQLAVSPETIKKLELMVHPKEAVNHSYSQQTGEKRNEKVVKISATSAAKQQPAKGNKDRPKR